MLIRQKRDEVPEGTLSCPDRNLAVFHHYRHYEGLRLLPSVCDSKLIQQTLFKSVSSGISVLTRITLVIRNNAKSTKYSLRLSSSQKDSIFPMASIIFFTSDTCLVSLSSYFDFFMRLIRNFVICGLIANWIRNSSSFPQKHFISLQTFGSIEETTIHISHNVVNLC